MLTLPSNMQFLLADRPADFRKSFDGLAAIVENELGLAPSTGSVFVFLNKRANQVRLLFWDRDGFCLISKRLEAGTFRRIRCSDDDAKHIEINTAELVLLLEGIDAPVLKQRKRYLPPVSKSTFAPGSVTNP